MSTFSIQEIPRVAGRSALVREVQRDGKKVEVDFWNEVTRMTPANMEKIMTMSSMDNDYSMNFFISQIEYQGFNREFYITHALTKLSVSVFCRFAIIGAVRGSNFTKIIEQCERMPEDLISAFSSQGFVKKPSKKTDLTILRCTASIPHWCAYHLLKAGMQKRLPVECPAPIQFPGAASLPMRRDIRIAHLKYCAEFSSLLPGGQFNMNIYMTAANNLIPVSAIPSEILSILGVASESESHRLTAEETQPYTKALTVTK